MALIEKFLIFLKKRKEKSPTTETNYHSSTTNNINSNPDYHSKLEEKNKKIDSLQKELDKKIVFEFDSDVTPKIICKFLFIIFSLKNVKKDEKNHFVNKYLSELQLKDKLVISNSNDIASGEIDEKEKIEKIIINAFKDSGIIGIIDEDDSNITYKKMISGEVIHIIILFLDL